MGVLRSNEKVVCDINHSLVVVSHIKNNIDILTVIDESHVQLKKSGRNFIGLCPFHSERTPSFVVNPKKNIYKCFGCGISGDQINLYAQLHGLDNRQAISKLAKRIGLGSIKLTEGQELEISTQQGDRNLERLFEEECERLFYSLCDLRYYMRTKVESVKRMEQLEQESLLVRYYHDKAYHEDLLDGLLASLLKEINIDSQIDYFFAATNEVELWIDLLESQ